MQLVIFDLDNCVSDDEMRLALIDWEATDMNARYDRYHMRCGDDAPRNMGMIVAMCRGQAMPAFCTSRPESVRATTHNWIARHSPIPSRILMMRRSDNHEPSTVVKRHMLLALRAQGHDVLAAFDDREDVVRMYREQGVAAARLWVHDRCAMTPPAEFAEERQ